MNLKKIAFFLHALGWGVTSRTAHYALMRDKIEKQFRIDSPSDEYILPGNFFMLTGCKMELKLIMNMQKQRLCS